VLLTLDTYSHVTDTLSSQAADIIDELFASSKGRESRADAQQLASERPNTIHVGASG
jgi:hypothetical protein